EHVRAVARLDHGGTAPGRAGRKVDRAQQLRRALDEDERLLLVPGMIAASDHVGAGVDELVIDHLRDTKTAGRVLAIDGDEIELPVADQPGQALQYDRAPAAPDDVTDEQDTHKPQPRISIVSRSVSTRSSRTSRGVVSTTSNSCAANAIPTATTRFF